VFTRRRGVRSCRLSERGLPHAILSGGTARSICDLLRGIRDPVTDPAQPLTTGGPMQNNPLQNNGMAFWAGLVLIFLGLAAAVFYLVVRTSTESLLLPGPTFRLKHFGLALVVIAAGAVIASFARPRSSAMSSTSRFNRQA